MSDGFMTFAELSVIHDDFGYRREDGETDAHLMERTDKTGGFSNIDRGLLHRIADATERTAVSASHIEAMIGIAMEGRLRNFDKRMQEARDRFLKSIETAIVKAETIHGPCPKTVRIALVCSARRGLHRKICAPSVEYLSFCGLYVNDAEFGWCPFGPQVGKWPMRDPCGPKTKTRAAYNEWMAAKIKKKSKPRQ